MTLIPDTAALYHGDDDDGIDIHQRSVNQQSDSMAPKLPFDVNDYLNFELNEDFISSSGDFINDYSTSDSNQSDSCFSVHQSSSKSLDGGFNQLTYEMDIFDKENYDYEHDYNDISRYGEFNDDDDTCYLKNYKLSSGAQPTLPSNDFKVFEYDHKDFNCSVITKLNNSPCKNKITCNFHSIPEKSKVERCDSVLKLIKNFKYLQKLNEDISKFTRTSKSKSKSNGYTAASRMKRHNSFNDSSHIKKKPQLLNPIDILNDNDDYYQNEEDDDEFINTLILKIGLLKNDPQERLLEFQYKTELKNLATIEYYNQNQFTL